MKRSIKHRKFSIPFRNSAPFVLKNQSKSELPSMNIYNAKLHSEEKPIASVYRAIDNDLARDNLENDITAADLQDISLLPHR